VNKRNSDEGISLTQGTLRTREQEQGRTGRTKENKHTTYINNKETKKEKGISSQTRHDRK